MGLQAVGCGPMATAKLIFIKVLQVLFQTYTALLTPNWINHVFTGPMKGGPEPVYGSWVIEGLQEGVGYMARVQAKNRYLLARKDVQT